MNKKLIKLLGALSIIALLVFIFNQGAVLPLFQGQVVYFYVILLLFAVIPAYIVFETWVAPYLHRKKYQTMTGTTRMKQALKPEVRRKNARAYINELRMTDSAMMASNGQEMVLLRHEPSPSREDAVQFDLFTFTTTEEYTDCNPLFGIDGIPANKLFYVICNSFTGECYLLRFETHKEAQEYFYNLWEAGVKKHEPSEFEKHALTGLFEEKGKMAAHEKSEQKEKSDENE